MKTITYQEYYKKLVGCFMGKAIGGTLGMPLEGSTEIHHVTFYDPIPTTMVANDDLDLQVVWLENLRKNGLPVNRKHLSESWTQQVAFPVDEYGIALKNLITGVYAPASGFFGNKFYNGMGAAIRSEIWATLCPGSPELAARFAREDACVDHCYEGLDACVFLAVIESTAFFEKDAQTIIDLGLSYIPQSGRLSTAICDTIEWWNKCTDWIEVREKILGKYPCDNFTDVTINLCFIVLAWLAENGDFSKSICTVTNMGYDTDCTAATLGSILGIINPDSIDEKWTTPIGQDLVLSPYIVGMHEAKTIGDMCDQIAALCLDIQAFYHTDVQISSPPDLSDINSNAAKPWMTKTDTVQLLPNYSIRESLISVKPFIVNLLYPENISLIPGEPATYFASISNIEDACVDTEISLRVPDGWTVEPNSLSVTINHNQPSQITFVVTAPKNTERITDYNPLQMFFSAGSLSWDISAGLQVARPWRFAADYEPNVECPVESMFTNAEIVYAPSYYQKICAKSGFYAINFHMHRPHVGRVIAHGTRPLKVWIDRQLVLEHQAEFYTPSVHRQECATKMDLKDGWHQVVIYVEADSTGKDGELFFGIGNPLLYDWFHEMSWKMIYD